LNETPIPARIRATDRHPATWRFNLGTSISTPSLARRAIAICGAWVEKEEVRRPMEFPHLMIIAGAVLVVLGIVAFAFSDDPA
jgi:hypothetical protein